MKSKREDFLITTQTMACIDTHLTQVEKLLVEVEERSIKVNNVARTVELLYLLRGQLTMAKFARKALSNQIAYDYQQIKDGNKGKP